MIRRTKSGYIVVSRKGKKLSKPLSEAGARRRMAQVEYFKKHSK